MCTGHLCKICYEREINTARKSERNKPWKSGIPRRLADGTQVILDCQHRAVCSRCLDQAHQLVGPWGYVPKRSQGEKRLFKPDEQQSMTVTHMRISSRQTSWMHCKWQRHSICNCVCQGACKYPIDFDFAFAHHFMRFKTALLR